MARTSLWALTSLATFPLKPQRALTHVLVPVAEPVPRTFQIDIVGGIAGVSRHYPYRPLMLAQNCGAIGLNVKVFYVVFTATAIPTQAHIVAVIANRKSLAGSNSSMPHRGYPSKVFQIMSRQPQLKPWLA
eukprot:CAMPEP_0117786288 /NCGR_PEP_ID=MMETSP0948-20121206/5751_1 /TAXON_ID=44440 /ORGANISM="Chattonella subsalsa, Strain CCMP2191" /LENGTH=130 /DNA_ID=CAMNT_0005615279 /DNA_START=579 /DNA_END=971 /DNA_ORIENTATION=-